MGISNPDTQGRKGDLKELQGRVPRHRSGKVRSKTPESTPLQPHSGGATAQAALCPGHEGDPVLHGLFSSFLFFGFTTLTSHFSVSTAQTSLNSSGPGSDRDKEMGEEGDGGVCRKEHIRLPACVWSPEPHLVVQLPTAACPGLRSMASFWASPAPSPEAPSTLAATPATAWWDTAWPFVPGTPRATTCGARPFLSVKVRSTWKGGDRWLGSCSPLGLVPGPITSKCGGPH